MLLTELIPERSGFLKRQMAELFGEIDIQTQVKLLRFFETKTFSRAGSTDVISVDVRTVCATNRDLYKMVADGQFRDDLFYRLNVITLHLFH